MWWAEYPLHRVGLIWRQYHHFDTFLKDKPWWLPKWAARLGITPILHQFTEKGRAQMYGANATTNHPVYKTGIQSADLNVGLVDFEDYYVTRFGPYGAVVPPPSGDCPNDSVIDLLWDTVANHEARILQLENKPTPPEPEPTPPPLTSVRAKVTRSNGAPAWAVTKVNENGIPIIETNVTNKTNDPYLKFQKDQVIRVQPRAITADGGIKFFILDQVPLHGYPMLYVKKDHVMKLE
jgi:hypothetical protein